MTWLRRVFGRGRLESELSQEIQAHLDETVEELMREGLSRDAATAAARRRFGNVLSVEQDSREVWQWPSLESFGMDLHYAARQLARKPGLAAVLLLTLGVGIGANATLFTWTRAILLDPLPGAGEPDRVLAIESMTPSGDWVPVSYPDFRDLREASTRLQSMTVAYPMGLAVGEDPALRVPSELVSGDYFDLLRVRPLLGRFFSVAERDHAQNRHAVVVISHALWVNHYNSDPAAIGSTLRINRYPFTVIGVAPAGFRGSMPGVDLRLWAPATMFAQLNSAGQWMLEDRKTRMFRVLARLADGAEIGGARAELQSLAARLAEAHPDTSRGMNVNVLPLWQSHYGLHDSLRAPLGLLSAVAGVVLLIVCANTANLLLARATDRRRELGLRAALGAERGRLVRQLLTEAAFVSLAGSLLGLLIAFALSGSLKRLVPASTALNMVPPRPDWSVLVFTALLAVVVTLLAGVAPALLGAREDVNDALKEGGRAGSPGAKRHWLRGALVTAEMALAITAIVAAGLFLKSFRLVASVEPGFDPEHVALGQFSMAASGFDAAQADAFCRRLRERLLEQPGVVAVSYADYVPLSIGRGSWEDLQVEGYVPDPSEDMKLYRSIVAPGYFELMRIPLLAGRDFDRSDDDAHSPAMIVNQEFVRRFFGGQYAIGRKVHGWGRWFSIVGVVRDSKVYRLSERPTPYFYIPLRQVYRPEFLLTFYARTSGSTDEAVASLRRLAGEVAAPPLFNTRSMSESIADSMFRDRTAAMLLSVLAAIAFVLAAIGLYGVMAYAVAQRTGEIGIRIALGAHRGDVVRLVLRQVAGVLLAGLVAGLLGGALLARAVSAMLFAVSSTDPAVYASAAGCAALIAIAATIVPTARALRVDPIRAMRCE